MICTDITTNVTNSFFYINVFTTKICIWTNWTNLKNEWVFSHLKIVSCLKKGRSFCKTADYRRVNNRSDYRSRKSQSARGAAMEVKHLSPWRILRRSGSRVSSFFLPIFLFFFAVEKSKPEIEVSVSQATKERNCGKKCGEESRASDRKRPLSEIFLTKNRRLPFDVSLRLSRDSSHARFGPVSWHIDISLLDYCRSTYIIYADPRKSSVLNGNRISGSWKMYSHLDFKVNQNPSLLRIQRGSF